MPTVSEENWESELERNLEYDNAGIVKVRKRERRLLKITLQSPNAVMIGIINNVNVEVVIQMKKNFNYWQNRGSASKQERSKTKIKSVCEFNTTEESRRIIVIWE